LKTCPECGIEVRPVWPTCKSCGTLLMARPEALAPVGAPPAGATAGAATSGAADAPPANPIPEAEQFFAPAVLQPPPQVAPEPWLASSSSPYRSADSPGEVYDPLADTRKWMMLAGVVLFLIAAVATAYFTFGSAAKKAKTPVVLAPKPPTNGLTTSLNDVVRMVAESSRRNALQAVESVGSGNLVQLKSAQSNYIYIAGDQASTDPQTVSVAQNESTVTIAVSGSNKDICAYGRWSPNATPMYVTMAHEPSCAATTAPNVGWSSEPGGAASDLPDDPG